MNPNAHFQQQYTLEEVQNSRMVADPLHLLECCPRGEGGAAAIVTTPQIAQRLGRHPLVSVAASAFKSELHTQDPFAEWILTDETARVAYESSGIGPRDLDLVQVHDAVSSEEIEYYEALGICPPGEGDGLVMAGETEIGGRIPFNTDGGLISRGHPIGPTGLAQIWETTLQLRGAAGPRQVEGATVGLAQMIGAGSVCVIHILKR
jgi:acetyl-CoA acetyltransferase